MRDFYPVGSIEMKMMGWMVMVMTRGVPNTSGMKAIKTERA